MKSETKELTDHLLSADNAATLSEVFKQLGDPTRLRIFLLLCHVEENVQGIAAAMNMSSPAVSHHLRILKATGLLVSKRKGKLMYYKAADDEIAQTLHHVIEHVEKITCPNDHQ